MIRAKLRTWSMTSLTSRVSSSRSSMTSRPWMMLCAHVGPPGRVDQMADGVVEGSQMRLSKSTTMTIGLLARSDGHPIFPSRPRARAPFAVAIRRTVLAGSTVGSRVADLVELGAGVHLPEKVQVVVAGAPVRTQGHVDAHSSSRGTGAMPEASFMLLSGLWTTWTPCRPEAPMSSSFRATQ